MQIKYYTILEGADMSMIQAWAADPQHGCLVIAQGRQGQVTHSLCVYTPPHTPERHTEIELALSGMITETTFPE